MRSSLEREVLSLIARSFESDSIAYGSLPPRQFFEKAVLSIAMIDGPCQLVIRFGAEQ